MKRQRLSMVLTTVLLLGLLSLSQVEAASYPFEGLVLKIAYDFDFWPENDRTVGTELDENGFFSSAAEAGYSTMFMGTKDAAFKDSGEVSGLGFRHESIVEESGNQYYVAFALSQRHEKNPNGQETFPNAKFFTFYVDTTNYARDLELYPIIYEQDYNLDGSEAEESCLSIADKSIYYVKDLDGNVTTLVSGNNYITIPQNFQGRVYLPLDKYVPMWGTKDVNNKFNGLKIDRYHFSFINIGDKGEWVNFDEFGFLLEQ